jgi:4-amino-4-deoxy-L-arabinose transferase-like glycosyltransferase
VSRSPAGSPGSLIAAAAIVGFALRLAFALGYWVDRPLTHDEQEYLQLAKNIREGRGLVYDPPAPGEPEPERFGRAPLYPAFLAGVMAVSPPDPTLRNVRVAQCFIGAVGVWVIALLARRAAGSRAAVIAAFIAAIYPPLVWICAFVLSEALYSTVALATALLLSRVFDETRERVGGGPATALCAAGGLLAGVAVLIRPAMLFFLILAGLWLLWQRRWTWLAALTLGTLAAVLPWTARNAREHGRFVLVASEGGITFWTGNHPLSPGEGDMAANPAIKLDNQRFRAEHPGLSPEALEPIYYREALGHIRERPLWWGTLLARKVFFLIVPVGPSYTLHANLYYGATLLSYGLLLPFGVVGLWRLRRDGRWPRALGLLAASAVLASVVFLPQERFRIPVIDPTLIVGAGACLAHRRP